MKFSIFCDFLLHLFYEDDFYINKGWTWKQNAMI